MLVTPFSMLISASTKSGKTELAKDIILNHFQLFDNPIHEVVWLYHKAANNEKEFSDLKSRLNIPVSFIEGFQAEKIVDGTLFKTDKLKCLVLDDVVVSALKSPVFIDLFTVLSHHQSIVVIAILQNLHADTASQRQIMNNVIRNLSYLVLFPDRRNMNACKQIARSYFSGEEHRLIEPFKHLIEKKERYTYMVVDFEESKIQFNCLRPTDQPFEFKFTN